MESIIQLRDRINEDVNYIRYKTLVGFEIVFMEHWDDENWGYEQVEEYRLKQVDRFVDELEPDNESEMVCIYREMCIDTIE